jgi:hypothetical protein
MSYGKPWRPQPARLKTSGPWKGMRFVARGPGVNTEEYLFAAGNALLDETGGWITRPGAKRQNSSALSGTPQLTYEFRKKDGTLYRIAISGGQIYKYAAGSYSLSVTTANFGSASVTRSTTARMYAVTLDDVMVITDGVNKPFTWTGADGAGGLAEVTAASVWYGQPTVYYAKVFGIINSDRLTIEWSDENDPAAGYGAAQSWTLGQTSSVPLVGLRGTNEALYYWRMKGMGAIRGPVDDNFTTTGTQDAIDSTLGLGVTHGHQEVMGAIWFVDQEGKLWKYDGRLTPLWEQYAAAFAPAGTGAAGSSVFGTGWTPLHTAVEHLRSLGVVIVSYAIGGNSSNAFEHFIFQAESGNMVSDWIFPNGYTLTAIWYDATNNVDEWVGTTSTGFTFAVGVPGVFYDEDTAPTATAIGMVLQTHRMSWSGHVEQQFTRLDVVLNVTDSPATLTVSPFVNTSRDIAGGTLSTQTTAISSAIQERHVVWGMKRNGRWFSTTVTISSASTNASKPYGVREISVAAIPLSVTPVLT